MESDHEKDTKAVEQEALPKRVFKFKCPECGEEELYEYIDRLVCQKFVEGFELTGDDFEPIYRKDSEGHDAYRFDAQWASTYLRCAGCFYEISSEESLYEMWKKSPKKLEEEGLFEEVNSSET